MERHRVARDESRWQFAAVRSDIWNVHRDLEEHEPLSPARFMPGAKTEEDEWREFVEMVQNGERFEVDEASEKRFRSRMSTLLADVGQ
jgi:hypothetical protein